ncbi:hypothetical protein GCM10010299_69080 [Streptomyces tanashiensis]|nr:hypothetical protein GCM10010299_69080 [Streptomyces tanashiensis]
MEQDPPEQGGVPALDVREQPQERCLRRARGGEVAQPLGTDVPPLLSHAEEQAVHEGQELAVPDEGLAEVA